MKSIVSGIVGTSLMGALVVSGCGPAGAGDEAYGEATAASSTVIFSSKSTATVGACVSGQAPVTVAGTFSTNRGLSLIQVTMAINGGAADAVGTLIDSNFSVSPGLKTAPYSYTETLASGHYTLNLCFYQNEAGGRTSCEPLTVDVSCPVDPVVTDECADVGFFGVLVTNPNVGSDKGPDGIPVHVRGDLGDAPQITFEGPNGLLITGTMRKAGDSCNYQYKLPKNSPVGFYRCTVTGNGHTYTFDATIP